MGYHVLTPTASITRLLDPRRHQLLEFRHTDFETRLLSTSSIQMCRVQLRGGLQRNLMTSRKVRNPRNLIWKTWSVSLKHTSRMKMSALKHQIQNPNLRILHWLRTRQAFFNSTIALRSKGFSIAFFTTTHPRE